MNPNSVSLTYRKTAVQNASPAGLVIILYDMLVSDLNNAIEAMGQGNIERRSEYIKHALLILQQLEGSLDMERGGEAAKGLARFYSYIRAQVLEAQIKVKPDLLRKQIEFIIDVRQAWQQVDAPSVEMPEAAPIPVNSFAMPEEHHGSAWSA